ncbi:MAG: flagellar motor protein [Myxococcota bacterium]
MDRFSLLGLCLGIGAVFATQLIEGGNPAALAQGPAALIVFVGTLGATLLSCGDRDLKRASAECIDVFRPAHAEFERMPARFRDLAFVARKSGLIALDNAEGSLLSPFMSRALRHVIDGCDSSQLRGVLEADARTREAAAQGAAEVFEVAGGYAPTMGILGAVLGLIQAMESLGDPSALGAGIAIAFVATIYGVGIANLLLLPIASKIRQRARDQYREDLLVIEGTIGLESGISPRTLERALDAYLVAEIETAQR